MKCPKCLSELVRIENKLYETLEEHVSMPNMEHNIKRRAYSCPKGCIKGFFDPSGAGYGTFEFGKSYNAVNSLSWRIDNWDRFDWWRVPINLQGFGDFMNLVEVK